MGRLSRRGLAALAVAGLLASAVAACDSTDRATVTVVEQDYYGAPTPDTPAPGYLNRLFAAYEERHPGVRVTRQSPASPNYSSLVLSQIASGSAPDLLMVDNPDLDRLASAGVLTPLDTLGHPDTAGMNPRNVEETTYQGRLYALPLYTNTISIFYNKDLLRAAGITTLPRTWAQFLAAAKKAARPDHYGFVFSGQSGPGASTWQFEPWLWSNGGSLTDIDSPRSVQALDFWTQLVGQGAAPRDVVNWTQTQPIQLFESGRAAFCENGLWNIPTLRHNYPHLHWGVMSIPTRVAGQRVISPLGGEVWAIPKTTPERERAAFALLQDMARPDNVLPLARGLSAVPTRTALWQRPEWHSTEYRPFLSALRDGQSRTRVLTSNYPQVEAVIGDATEAALLARSTPAEAFGAAQDRIDQIRTR